MEIETTDELGSKIRNPNPTLEELAQPDFPAGAQPLQKEAFVPEPLLHNAGRPAVDLQREKPIHRAIVFLKAQGRSNREIADMLEVTPTMVAYVVKQPWAHQMIVDEIGSAGRCEVEVLLQGEVADSVRKLIELRDSDDAPKEVQRKSANDILDRFYGKPNQRITHERAEMSGLDDVELARIVKEGTRN